MSDKIVVRVQIDGDTVMVMTPDGDNRRQPLTDRVRKKLGDLTHGYFYATPGPEGLNLKRLAPFSEWDEAA